MNGFWQIAWAQLWQLTVVILIVAGLVRVFARTRPHLAHLLWLVVLIKCVTPPLLSSPSGLFSWVQTSMGDRIETGEVAATVPPPKAEVDSEIEPVSGELAAGLVIEGPRRLPPPVAQSALKPGNIVAPADRTEAIPATWLQQPPASSTGPKPDTRSPRQFAWNSLLSAAWLIGSLVIAVVGGIRWLGFLRELKRAGWRRDRSLELVFTRLSRKLGVRRRVRLIVTQGRIGPAVIGIFRPTVLLPSVVVDGKSPEDLEPILAHELMHLRRGDLWTGMLQVLAQTLWWFHPLVWLVNRLITRNAERCCDEAVVANLNCDPMRYARCLVDVLELKNSLKPVPVVPGVRPVEITSNRLERIMTLGQGSLKRTPWWCWIVMLAIAAMLLPGASLVAHAKGKNKDRRSRTRESLKQNDSGELHHGQPAKSKLTTCSYPVSDLFSALKSRFGLSDAQIPEQLIWEITSIAGKGDAKPDGARVDVSRQQKTLVVRHTREAHRRIRRHLEVVRKYGYDEVQIETRVVTADPEQLEDWPIRWKILDVDMPEGEIGEPQPQFAWQPLDRPFPAEGGRPQSVARTIIDKNTPVTQAIVENTQVDDLVSAIKSRSATANVLMMPKITCFNGRSVTMQDSVQRPFVVSLQRVDGDGSRAYQPRVRVVTEGITMRMRPVLQPDDTVWLDLELTLSEILGVETVQVQTGEDDPPTVQVPEVKTKTINSTLAIAPGKSLIIGGLTKAAVKGKPQSMLVVVRASKRAPDPGLNSAGTTSDSGSAQPKKHREPHHAERVPENLLRRLNQLEWMLGLPAGASIQETNDRYRVTASPWRTHFKEQDGRISTMFSADKGTLVLGKGDNCEVTLELTGNMTWQADAVRAFGQHGIWSNTSKPRWVLSGRVRFTDNEKQIQLVADEASFDSNRILLEGNAQIQRTANGRTDHITADRIEWDVDENAFGADGRVSFRTVDDKGMAASAQDAARTDSATSSLNNTGNPTGRLMFGTSTPSDAESAGQVVIDQNVQTASATSNHTKSDHSAQLQRLTETFNQLIDDERFAEAAIIAQQAKRLEPEHPLVENMLWKARFGLRIQKRGPYYLKDDVEHFPPGPESKLRKGVAKEPLLKYETTTAFRPHVDKCDGDLVPTDAEVMQALEKARPIEKDGATRHRVRVVKERIRDYLSPPQTSPLLGPAQQHHTRFKCTVYFTETADETSGDFVEVVYVDVVHTHLLDDIPVNTWEELSRRRPLNQSSPEEGRIQERLRQQRMTPEYNNVPLQKFADDVANVCGVKVVLERDELAAEGITSDRPITLSVDQPISVKSALNLVLEDSGMTYVVQDGILRITSKQAAGNPSYFVKTYNIADLVYPIPKIVQLPSAGERSEVQPTNVSQTLKELISSVIAPQTWDKVGGPGSIHGIESTQSVVVFQSAEVHQQIRELLEQMRRGIGVQVACDLQSVTMARSSYDAIGHKKLIETGFTVLSPKETLLLLEGCKQEQDAGVSPASRATLLLGQRLIAPVDYHSDRQSDFRERLNVVPTVTADRSAVNLAFATLADESNFAKSKKSCSLWDGHSVLIDVTDQLTRSKGNSDQESKLANERLFVLITPHILVNEDAAARK